MCRLYLVLRWFAQRWLMFASILVVAAFVCGVIGFWLHCPENSWATNAYLTILLFTMNNGEVAKNVDNGVLEAARWLGFVVWFFTIAAVLIRLFSQPALALVVTVYTYVRGGHVIVAGLGKPESERDRLVERLRALGRAVVVVEPDANHPGLEACRQAGAICQIGSPQEPVTLRRAGLQNAGTLLALCEDDRQNVHLLGMVASLLGSDSSAPIAEEEDPLAPPKPGNVGCVLQVSEPRLLQVLGRHDLRRDPCDRLNVRIFSVHEMVARAMLRECMIGADMPRLRKVMLLGTGAHGRLGQALVLRAIKDRWIDTEADSEILEFDIYDEHANAFKDCVLGGMDKDMADLCRLEAAQCLAHRHGFRDETARGRLQAANYDAVFICLGEESQALIQVAQLREIVPPSVPIIVRVHDETAGFGVLLQRANAGGLGENIHVVGSHDRMFDLAVSLNPMIEMIAQVLHQDYLSLTQEKIRKAEIDGDVERKKALTSKAAFVPWRRLAENYRDANRSLAQRLRAHMTVPPVAGRSGHRHRLQFSPQGLISPSCLFQLESEELEALAKNEHEMWSQDRLAHGWRYGPAENTAAKLSANLVPWADLDVGTQDYDRNIIRRLPHVFAKADYKVIRV